MTKRINKTYTREFKEQAVQLAQTSGKPKAQIARELGIADSLLYGWIERYAAPVQKEKKSPDNEKVESQRLRRELARVTEERDILKKAVAYFATASK